MAAEKLDTEIRQDQIAAAALEVLGARGVGELSMADIARRVGLAPSAICCPANIGNCPTGRRLVAPERRPI